MGLGLPGLANIRGVAESVDTPEDLLTSVEEGHVVHGLLAAISADDRQLLIETRHTPDLTVAQIFPGRSYRAQFWPRIDRFDLWACRQRHHAVKKRAEATVFVVIQQVPGEFFSFRLLTGAY